VIWGYYLWHGGTIPPGLTNVYSGAAGFNQVLALTGDGAPVITVQPFDQTVFAAGTASFQVMASGNQPLGYQWKYNGNPILGATNRILPLSNVALTAAGNYRCVVTNSLGSATSDSATLTVMQPPLRFDSSAGIVVSNGVAKLRLSGLSGSGNVVLYASTNLINWTSQTTRLWVLGSTMKPLPTRRQSFSERVRNDSSTRLKVPITIAPFHL